jgi:hypothetical protein
MKHKTSRRPLFIGLGIAALVLVASAMVITPTITPQKVEETLPVADYVK